MSVVIALAILAVACYVIGITFALIRRGRRATVTRPSSAAAAGQQPFPVNQQSRAAVQTARKKLARLLEEQDQKNAAGKGAPEASIVPLRTERRR